jgi:hypothetical protein
MSALVAPETEAHEAAQWTEVHTHALPRPDKKTNNQAGGGRGGYLPFRAVGSSLGTISFGLAASDAQPPLRLAILAAAQEEEAYLQELHTQSRTQPGQPAQDDDSPSGRVRVRAGPLTRAAAAALRASGDASMTTPAPCDGTRCASSCAVDTAPRTPRADTPPLRASLAQGGDAAADAPGNADDGQLPEAVDEDDDIAVGASSPSPPHSLHIGHHAVPSPELSPSNGHAAVDRGTAGGSPAEAATPRVNNGVAAEPAIQGEALYAEVGKLLLTTPGKDGLIDASSVPAMVRLVRCAAATPTDQSFITRVLEGIVTKSTPGSPLLKALVAGGALGAMELLVCAAAEAPKGAPLLCRLLKLAAALPVTLAAFKACPGLPKRAKKLVKYSATPGLSPDNAAQAAEVEAAAGVVVDKWMAQVAAETAAAKQTGSKAASGAAAPKAMRVVALDSADLFASAAPKAKASKTAAATTGAKGVAAGTKATAPRVMGQSDTPAKGVAPPRSANGPATSSAGTGPHVPAASAAGVVLSRMAAEQAARLHAAQMAEQHRASRHAAAVEEAVKEAMTWQTDLYPEGLPPPPLVIHSDSADIQKATPSRSCLSRKASQSKSGGSAGAGPQAQGDVAMEERPPVGGVTPQQLPAPAALRDRKRKRKSVVWAPEASLTQVREFTGDAAPEGESVAYPEPTMMTTMTGAAVDGDLLISGELVTRWLNRAKQETAAERRAMDAWRNKHEVLLRHPQAAPPPPTPLMTAIYTWSGPPPLVALPTWAPGGQPGRGETSSEVEGQARRQSTRPPTVYASLAAVPEHPAQGPARSERPEDNVNTRWIVHEAATPPVQQVAQPMQMQYQQTQPQHQGGMPFALPGGQAQSLVSFGVQQQQPQQQQQQPTFAMQMAPLTVTQPAPAPMQQWQTQPPSWLQQPSQHMPTMQTVSAPVPPSHPPPALPSWLTSTHSGAADPAQQQQQSAVGAAPPAAAVSGDQLGDLVRSLTQGGNNASVLQQALEGILHQQHGSAPAPQAFSAAAFTTPGSVPPPPSMMQQNTMGMDIAPPHRGNGQRCHFYNRPGGCRQGALCRFQHAL